jgi:hypothetical protein
MKVVETIIKEVEIKDVLSRYTLTQKPIDDLEQIGGLSAAANPDANSGLARDCLDFQSPRNAGLKSKLLKIQYD